MQSQCAGRRTPVVVPEQPGLGHVDAGFLQSEGDIQGEPLTRVIRIERQPGHPHVRGEEQLPPLREQCCLAEACGSFEQSNLPRPRRTPVGHYLR